MPTNPDILTAARAFNTDIESCGINPQRAHELIEALVSEVKRLRDINPPALDSQEGEPSK